MPLVKWNPLPELEELRRRMNVLDQDSRALVEDCSAQTNPWQPPADVYEDDEQILLFLELPGVLQDDIELKIEEHQLLVSGERGLAQREGYQRIEGNYGPFRRLFALPPGIDEEDIRARCENGVLRIMLPKEPAGKPKQIVVEAD